ncbi:glycosyltransferase family 8 protein [Amaricoccus solimangrovi]|uniref:glycosyltransferase family 8 protein n=1 Tax=Amaricoccus solimangrovi TaxID=2589815 RepID=UPI001F33662F|nr:glycosyltransferase family 8 protein [Amaricoccus solimangrovi]
MTVTIELAAGDAPKSDKAIVFACDANYAPFAWFAAARIAALSPGRDFDICLAATEPLTAPAGLAIGARICRIGTGDAFAALCRDTRRTGAAYLRYALPRALGRDYRRILYLDADIFPQAGDLSALLDIDLLGHAVGAVRDNSQWRTPSRRPRSFGRLGLPWAPYFNSGVLLIDTAAYEAAGVLDRALALGAEYPPERIGLDQELINATLRGDWAELSPVWNWQYTWASRLLEGMVCANLVHFIGHRKPWTHDGGELPPRFRRAYRAFLATHFPDRPPIGPDGMLPHRNPVFLYQLYLKHLVSTWPMIAYLSRFPDELTALEPD